MKKLCFLTALTVLTTVTEAYGKDTPMNANYNYGSQSYGKETLSSIQTNGTLILEGTKVLGLVQVNGSFEADEANIENLHINGQAEIKNSLIKNDTKINGTLIADNTKFQHELSVASQKITLRTCSVDTLIVRAVAGFDGIQVVDLRSGTTITGPIYFESGTGEIWLSSNSEASGEITGARVVRK